MAIENKKLYKFRQKLEQYELHGFIVPMSDEYQNEYVPPRNRRLEWLSGFSGSAGSAVITKDAAAFFTDGRYTLQARKQLNQKNWKIYNIAEIKPDKWLTDNIEKGTRIGIDPWLHTEDDYRKYKKNAEGCGFVLVQHNILIDEIWDDRPDEIKSQAFIHDKKYCGISFKDKIKIVANDIKKNNAEHVLLSSPESVCWLLNIRGGDIINTPLTLCRAIVGSDGRVFLFINPSKISAKIIQYLGKNISIHDPEDILEFINKIPAHKIMADSSSTPSAIFKSDFINAKDPCILPKACKNKIEISGVIHAHIRDGAALCDFLHWLEKNLNKITEITAAEKLLEFRKRQNLFHSPSFDTISAVGSNGAIVHYRAEAGKDKLLVRNNMYLLDSGAQYLDGTTDVTRTIILGKATPEQKLHFTLVLKGHIAIARAVFPEGTTGSSLDILARYYLWQNGLDYDHGTGHGVGHFLSVHEGPQRISKSLNQIGLKPGMIISNEPGCYIEGKYGIRIENLVTVTEAGEFHGSKKFLHLETLTLVPIDTNLINKNLLNNDEIKWLNNYHSEIRKKISPLLDKEARKWLSGKTKKI